MRESARFQEEVSRNVLTVLSQAVDQGRIAGGVVLVALNGVVVAQEAAGYENIALAIPMHINARFRLASVTKPIVSLAALKLVHLGILDLHEPITNWLPYFRPRLANGRQPDITLHHLLSHSSGLSYGFQEAAGSEYERFGVSDGLDCSGLTLAENLRRLGNAKLKFEPGAAWQYSLGLDVVGAIIECATESALPDAIGDLICRPLGLNSLAFAAKSQRELAVPYIDSSGTLTEMPEPAEVVPPDSGIAIRFSPRRAHAPNEFPSGGAGMVGDARDILKALETVRKDGAGFWTAGLHTSCAVLTSTQTFARRETDGDSDTWVPC